MKQVTLSKTTFSTLLRNAKLNEKIYVKISENQFSARNIDFKNGTGLLDQTTKLHQRNEQFFKPYYVAIDIVLLSKALKALKGEIVTILFDESANMFQLTSNQISDNQHKFGDRFDYSTPEVVSKMNRKLVDKKNIELIIKLEQKVLSDLLTSAETLDSTVLLTVNNNTLTARSCKIDGKNFVFTYNLSEVSAELEKRVYFGKFTKSIISTNEDEFCEMHFYPEFLVLIVKNEENITKELYLPLRK